MIASCITPTTDTEVQDRALFRLMATSDVHANLLPYDYFTDQADQPYGLSRLATLIKRLRTETANTLLVDNGDMLQGTPLSDFSRTPAPDTAADTASEDTLNPIIDAMNALGYDAAGLGNHEFNFGLAWLQRATGQARFRNGAGPCQWFRASQNIRRRIHLPPDLRHKFKSLLFLFHRNRTSGLKDTPVRASLFRP